MLKHSIFSTCHLTHHIGRLMFHVSKFQVRGRIARHLNVSGDHLFDQVVQAARGRVPPELRARLFRVAQQQLDLGRAEKALVHLDDRLAFERAVGRDNPDLVDALARKLDRDAGGRKRQLAEAAHRRRDPCRHNVIVGRVALQHEPHAAHVVARVAPVALRAQVAEHEAVLHAQLDARDGHGDLARHKVFAAAGGLVVEQDAVAGKHVVGLAVVFHDPEPVQLGDAVGGPRVKGRGLALGDLVHQAVELRGGRLVEFRVFLETGDAHGLEHVEDAQAVDVARVLGHLERDLDVALRGQVVHLVGAGLAAFV